MDPNYSEIGSRIREQREYLGLSREAFAEKIGVTPKFCSDIELGLKGMSLPTLCKISKVLHLSILEVHIPFQLNPYHFEV